MNPTSNQNAFPGQQPQAPATAQNSVQAPVSGGMPLTPMPVKKSSHVALTTTLVILILAIMALIGWKWFSTQQFVVPVDQAAMTEDEAASPAPQVVEGDDALDSDMALILNASSESDLKSIDGEF